MKTRASSQGQPHTRFVPVLVFMARPAGMRVACEFPSSSRRGGSPPVLDSGHAVLWDRSLVPSVERQKPPGRRIGREDRQKALRFLYLRNGHDFCFDPSASAERHREARSPASDPILGDPTASCFPLTSPLLPSYSDADGARLLSAPGGRGILADQNSIVLTD